MSRLRTILRKSFLEGPYIRPGSRWWVLPLYFAVGVWLHYVFVYALATGKMRARISTGWIEGRESTPVLYWIYVCGFGTAVLLADGLFIYRLLQKHRNARRTESASPVKSAKLARAYQPPASLNMPVHCQRCTAVITTDHVKIGMTIACPSCGMQTQLEYTIGSEIPPTGYSLTFANFMQLLSEPLYRHRIGPLMERWFECLIENAPSKTSLRKKDGSVLIAEDVHFAIQSDASRQYEIYQTAMDLWR
jgi:hypothetical protein